MAEILIEKAKSLYNSILQSFTFPRRRSPDLGRYSNAEHSCRAIFDANCLYSCISGTYVWAMHIMKQCQMTGIPLKASSRNASRNASPCRPCLAGKQTKSRSTEPQTRETWTPSYCWCRIQDAGSNSIFVNFSFASWRSREMSSCHWSAALRPGNIDAPKMSPRVTVIVCAGVPAGSGNIVYIFSFKFNRK
jgi:hypothetical protein